MLILACPGLNLVSLLIDSCSTLHPSPILLFHSLASPSTWPQLNLPLALFLLPHTNNGKEPYPTMRRKMGLSVAYPKWSLRYGRGQTGTQGFRKAPGNWAQALFSQYLSSVSGFVMKYVFCQYGMEYSRRKKKKNLKPRLRVSHKSKTALVLVSFLTSCTKEGNLYSLEKNIDLACWNDTTELYSVNCRSSFHVWFHDILTNTSEEYAQKLQQLWLWTVGKWPFLYR